MKITLKNKFQTLVFCLSLVCITFYSCDVLAPIPKDAAPDNPMEQSVFAFSAALSAAGGDYQYPEYNLGTELARVKSNYREMKAYALKNNFNPHYVFIINMRLPSFKKRLFVYNMKKDSLESTALVSHGIGSETFKGKLIFSNIPNSNMTSLGKYKIGSSYIGKWGFSYRLHGLDSTNSKAFERAVVLHSYKTIPDDQVNDNPIALSQGCPMVSPNFLQKIKGYVGSDTKKPILMNIFY